MTLTVVDLPTSDVSTDLEIYPDTDGSYVYRDLLHLCSLLDDLPAILIRVGQGSVRVVGRHEYLSVARDLGRPTVRAVIDHVSDDKAVASLLRRPDVVQLDPTQDGDSGPVVEQWQVIGFGRALTQEEQQTFESGVAAFFEGLARGYPPHMFGDLPLISDVQFGRRSPSVQFRARMPLGDERWFDSYRQMLKAFSSRHVPITSYQGHYVDW